MTIHTRSVKQIFCRYNGIQPQVIIPKIPLYLKSLGGILYLFFSVNLYPLYQKYHYICGSSGQIAKSEPTDSSPKQFPLTETETASEGTLKPWLDLRVVWCISSSSASTLHLGVGLEGEEWHCSWPKYEGGYGKHMSWNSMKYIWKFQRGIVSSVYFPNEFCILSILIVCRLYLCRLMWWFSAMFIVYGIGIYTRNVYIDLQRHRSGEHG